MFTLFVIVVTNKGIGNALSGAGVRNENLGEYSGWLQNHVINAENWDKIKSCLVNVRLCDIIEGGKDEDFYKQKLSPIQVIFYYFHLIYDCDFSCIFSLIKMDLWTKVV